MNSQRDEMPHPLQVEAWCRLGPERRSQMGVALRRQVRAWKTAALREQHPDWSDERLQRELAAIYLRGNT